VNEHGSWVDDGVTKASADDLRANTEYHRAGGSLAALNNQLADITRRRAQEVRNHEELSRER